MHPIERLRHVARVEGADPAMLAREVASSLAEVADAGLAGLVPACRRLVEHHPANGPLWWLSARMLASAEPCQEAREAAAALANDPTARRLADLLPEEATVLVVGWAGTAADALRRRGDLEVLVADSGGDGGALARRLAGDGDATLVPDRGLGAAAALSSLVLVEALVAGPSGVLAAPGSHAAAAVAARSAIPVWGVLPVGRVLPEALWQAALARFDGGGLEPWDRDAELVPAELLCTAVGPAGAAEPAEALSTATCPVAPELLRAAGPA